MASFSPGLGRQNDVPAGTAAPMPAVGVVLFDRYRLDERLGQGGMAEVWRAHDEQLNRDVAIKLLHRHLLPDERSRERFAAEARAVAGLSHPGIVTVHDILVDDHYAAMVLELVDGEALSDVLTRRGRLPESAAAAITAQVAHALQAAHDRGLVHRDVKPANVLLAPDGRARLVDFGIARMLDDRDSSLTMPGTIMGTLRYMAPEQLADGAADRGTDVFGLGSLLYEMLVGRPPFPAATPAALMAQQRQGAPPGHGASAELAGLARTALQHDPERRPRSAGRMASLLERWLENRGVSSADLPAVTAAAISGGPMPRPAPPVVPIPAVMPAPIVEPVAAATAATPVRRRARPKAGDVPLDTVLAPEQLAPLTQLPLMGTLDPAATAAGTPAASAALPTPSAMASTLAVDAAADTAAVTAARPSTMTPFAIVRRRVPLITAVGLAGVLLAGLLLAGALTGLQAGAARPSPSPSHPAATVPAASPAPAATAVPTPAPTATPASVATPGTKPGKDPKPSKDPPKRRGN